MRIAKIIDQMRRDFTAIYECENCGYTEKGSGYDDRNFHDNVIPDMKCKECKKSRSELGIIQVPTATRYSEDTIV